ncbi:MAG: hypothetical protein B5M56_03510 [Desulfococcus sp. 4484_241]|nr:MAG: hypothetical protein B5M56_03510 [Desulfococcus sp. 4484_241]
MADKQKNRVLVLDASYDDRLLADAMDKIFQEFPMDLEGKNVLVKPNILAGEPPEKGVTTHPSLVRAIVNKLQQQGAKVMVGDNPGVFGYGRSEKAAITSGIKDAAGDCFVKLSRTPVRQKLSNRNVDHVTIAGDVLSADLVINLPKLKTHGLTFYTGAVKNTFGYVVGGDKMRTHSLAPTPVKFAEALVDIYAIRPPELNIMDAVTAMEGNGPHHGKLRELGKILASPNGVCLDAVAVHMIGRQPESIPHLKIAAQRGLGTIDISKIDLNTKIVPLRDFKMPATFVTGMVGIFLNRILSKQMSCLPVVVEEKCQKCGLCVKHCPVGAMKIKKDKCPSADKNICISCYCCQEMCPEDAIILKGRLLNFIRRSAH